MTEEEENKMEKDILFQIDMQLYDEFNDTIATMNDHLGDIYSLRDVEEVEKAEKEKEIKLLREAVKKLQADIEKQQKELDLKDKVIYLMAKCIQTDEKDYKDFCSGCKYDNEDCHGHYCKERTIEYFYKKAEE